MWRGYYYSINASPLQEVSGLAGHNALATLDIDASFLVMQILCIVFALLLALLRPLYAAIVTLTALISLLVFNLVSEAQNSIALAINFNVILLLFVTYLLLCFYTEVVNRRQLTTIFSQYIPPELAQNFSTDPESLGIQSESREITVMFCDIQNFTSISEKLEPQVLAKWLNHYFTLVSAIIVRHKGTIDKYMGDCIMAFWGAPIASDQHSRDALNAAIEIQQALKSLRAKLAKNKLPQIYAGIGISSGLANVGNIGSELRKAYTAIGDVVNIAERVEKQTRYYDTSIIISNINEYSMPDILFRELDTIQVKGKKDSIKMLQPIGPRKEASGDVLEDLSIFQQALELFHNDELNKAEELLKSLREIRPIKIYDIYLERITKAK